MSDLRPEELTRLIDALEANRILDALPLVDGVRRIRSVAADNFAKLPSFYVQAVENLHNAVEQYSTALMTALAESKRQEEAYALRENRNAEPGEAD